MFIKWSALLNFTTGPFIRQTDLEGASSQMVGKTAVKRIFK